MAVSITTADLENSLPDLTSTMSLSGIDEEIIIIRDNYGIPHVRAKSVDDAFFGQGFATAQDRLWHMESDRRRAYGRWAELVGVQEIESDIMMRKFQIRESSLKDLKACNRETTQMFESYSAGVNAFIRSTSRLPIEFTMTNSIPEEWEPVDSIAVYKVRHIMMGVFEGKLWRSQLLKEFGPDRTAELLRGYQPGHLLIVPPSDIFQGPELNAVEELQKGLKSIELIQEVPEAGSNSWVLHGSRTKSGLPLLAGDPHRGLDTPNCYYQNHLACEDFDVIGLSFPGCPGFPHFGHNEKVAWCVTHAMADYQDLFIEKFDSDDLTKYLYEDAFVNSMIFNETIKVKGGRDVELTLRSTRHGPVIAESEDGTVGLAFSYTSTLGDNLGFETFLPQMRAQSASDADEAMKGWVDPCNNYMYADIGGDIGYLNRGLMPIRSYQNAWLPVPGWDGKHDWQGHIPFKELPRVMDPANGYIVTANNKIVSNEYPYYLSLDYAPEYRAKRILEHVSELNSATVEDMLQIHSERMSIPASIYVPMMTKINPENSLETESLKILSVWDFHMDPDSIAASIYSAFRLKLHNRLLTNIFGPLSEKALGSGGRGAPSHINNLSTRFVSAAENNDLALLPNGENWDSIVSKAFHEGIEFMKDKYGSDTNKWHWGMIHKTRPIHTLSNYFPNSSLLLNPPSVSLGGDGDTPQAGSFGMSEPFVMTGTSVARYVFDLSSWDNSRWIVPLGASGHPGSSHYSDQGKIWSKVETIPMYYSQTIIETEADSVQRLSPAKV